MEDWGPSFSQAEEFEDRSIFNEKKFGQKMQEYFEPLREFIINEKTDGNKYPNALFAFPEKEPKNICVYKKELQAFMIYDIYLARYTRMITKPSFFQEDENSQRSMSMSQKSLLQNYEEESNFDSNAFDLDPRCKILVFAFGRYIKMVQIHMPDFISKFMTPQFKISEHKYSPAKLQEVK